MFWIMVAVTSYASGEIIVGPGTDLTNFPTRPACENALVGEKDFGFTTNWEIHASGQGLQLRYQQETVVSVVACVPVYP
jgi:hypothetical protein